MRELLDIIINIFIKNSFVMSFLFVGLIAYLSVLLSEKVFRGRIHSSAIAIFISLVLAYIGGKVTGGEKGLADIGVFSGLAVLGGSSLRDFAIVATSFGAKFSEIKKCGVVGIVALIIGILIPYICGALAAAAFGYTDAASVATIGAGAVTFVVGPVTGAALGVESQVIAISIAAGVFKSIAVMLLTPIIGKKIGLTTPRAAMIFGGLMGTTSGTTAGLTAIDTSLVPYAAMTATFHTGLGCLLCPSLLYSITTLFF